MGNLRPYLYKNYSLKKVGIYNTNADIHLLITRIEQLIKNNKEKDLISINNKSSHSPTLLSTSTCDSFKSSNTYNFNKNKKDFDFKKLLKKNELKNDIDIILENENEFNENERINNNNNIEVKKSNLINSRVNLFNSRITGINKNLPKSKSISICNEMKPNYIEKDEIELKTIEHLPHHRIKLIDINLLLKKVTENSFSLEENKVLYSFIKQSFSFINLDIFLKKIKKCYEHYRLKDKLNPKVQHLVEFFNAFIIEMIIYNKSVIFDNKILEIINSFYINLKDDIINIIKYKKLSRIKNQQIKYKLLKEKIYVKEMDKDGEEIRWWSKELVIKKLKIYHKLNLIKYHQILEKEKIEKEKNLEDDINKSKLQNENEIIPKNKPRLSLTKTSNQFDILKRVQTFNISGNNNINSTTHNPNVLTTNDQKKKKNILNDEQLIKIIGKKYEDLIKNAELLVSKEENFLLILKNITKLLKQKTYSEEVILKTKSRENFYANFINKNKDIIKDLKTQNRANISTNKDSNLNMHEENKISFLSDKKNYYFCTTNYGIEQIGEKLISISKNLLYKIEYKELYGAIFTKNEKYIKSPNIMSNIRHFNNLVLFIVEDILSYDTPKERAKIIDQWALIVKYCKNRKDQSNCLAIHSALNHYIITGLDQTLNNIKYSTKNILKEIGDYCNLGKNYQIFREEIKNIRKDEFYIPYLGTILRDINFFEEKGKYIIQGNMINFEKVESVQNALDTFFDFKNRIDKVKVQQIEELNFFDNLEEKKEQDLEKLANDLEPEFKLGVIHEGIKRLTEIDKKYFSDNEKKK